MLARDVVFRASKGRSAITMPDLFVFFSSVFVVVVVGHVIGIKLIPIRVHVL